MQTDYYEPKPRPWHWGVRTQLVMWFARQLRVPVDVHGSYFYSGLNAKPQRFNNNDALGLGGKII